MFFTDPTIGKRLDSLEEEKKYIWSKIAELEQEVAKKTSDYEEVAKNSSTQAITYLNAIEVIKQSIETDLSESNTKLNEIKSTAESISNTGAQIIEISNAAKEKENSLGTILKEIEDRNGILVEKFTAIEEIVKKTPGVEENLKTLEDVFEKGNSTDTKIAALYQTIADKKKELDGLYIKLIGYKETDSEGKEIEVQGLKAELENTYSNVKNKLDGIDKELNDLKSETVGNYNKFIEDKDKIVTDDIKTWNEKLSQIENKITELLPRALTVGLSHAYSEKKESEIKEGGNHSKTFSRAIWGLVLVSLVPFAFSIKSLADGVELETIILRLPRLALAILPLYVPVLWVAYSANRRTNLSKRLAEEYSHKEVLSKTYEGLSRQINNLENKDISADLRIKLLYNILEVNSENPGKLISDYNKSDHPMMDALDKSVKLTNAVTKLAKIPGFAKLASSLERKSQEILKEEGKKANAAIESLEQEE